jgi:hypothetical protein
VLTAIEKMRARAGLFPIRGNRQSIKASIVHAAGARGKEKATLGMYPRGLRSGLIPKSATGQLADKPGLAPSFFDPQSTATLNALHLLAPVGNRLTRF